MLGPLIELIARIWEADSEIRDRSLLGESELREAVAQKAGEWMVGYWEWFRKDGTKLRSGSFEHGEQAGQRTTYDKNGQVYKATHFNPKAKGMPDGDGAIGSQVVSHV